MNRYFIFELRYIIAQFLASSRDSHDKKKRKCGFCKIYFMKMILRNTNREVRNFPFFYILRFFYTDLTYCFMVKKDYPTFKKVLQYLLLNLVSTKKKG